MPAKQGKKAIASPATFAATDSAALDSTEAPVICLRSKGRRLAVLPSTPLKPVQEVEEVSDGDGKGGAHGKGDGDGKSSGEPTASAESAATNVWMDAANVFGDD